MSATLLFAFGVNFELPRTSVVVKTVSIVFFILALASNIIFSVFNLSIPAYIVTNGILLLIYILIAYSIAKAKQ